MRRVIGSTRKAEKQKYQSRIKELYAEHKGMTGSPMLTVDLGDDVGSSKKCRNRVIRYVKEMGVTCPSVKRFVVITDSKHGD